MINLLLLYNCIMVVVERDTQTRNTQGLRGRRHRIYTLMEGKTKWRTTGVVNGGGHVFNDGRPFTWQI